MIIQILRYMALNNKQLFSCKIWTKNDGVKSSKNFKLLKYVAWRRNVGLVVEQIAFQLGYKFLFLKLFFSSSKCITIFVWHMCIKLSHVLVNFILTTNFYHEGWTNSKLILNKECFDLWLTLWLIRKCIGY